VFATTPNVNDSDRRKRKRAVNFKGWFSRFKILDENFPFARP